MRLGGWRTGLLSCGGRLVLLKTVLATIPMYYMLVFRMPAGVKRCLEKIMWSFFWRGPQLEETRGAALVAWKTVCRSASLSGLGIRNLLHTNMTLLTKWVCLLMQPSDNLVSLVLRDRHGPLLDSEIWQTSTRGDSTFMLSVRRCFPIVQRFFRP